METPPETVARLEANVAPPMESQEVREQDASTGKHTNHVQR
jgi:hypothetical protein